MVPCLGSNNLEFEQLFSHPLVCFVCLLANSKFPLPFRLLLGHRERVGMMFILEARGTRSGHHRGPALLTGSGTLEGLGLEQLVL